MAELLLVPEVAAGATEVVLSEWLVADGASFQAGDPIAVIETDKAIVEVEAESAATLVKALVEGGSTVGVGAPMALLGAADDVGREPDAMLAELGVGAPPEAPPSVDEPSAAEPAASLAASPAAPLRRDGEAPPSPPARRFASPLARKLLRDAGVPLDSVVGSGPHGRIVRRDVEAVLADRAEAAVAAAKAVLPAPPAPSSNGVVATASSDSVDEPHTRTRRAIATRLTESKASVPHFYLKRTAVLDELLALRSRLNEVSPTRLSVNDLLIRAVAVAHVKVPAANVIWTDDALRRYQQVDVAVAVASAAGLVTPVLRAVESSSLAAISTQVKAFSEQADAGRINQRDLEGGSITISNLGMYGVDEFAAIINPPHSMILAVGAARQTPVVVDGVVGVATTVDLVVSVDHRAIDGALAAQWTAALVDALEHPLQLVV